MSFERRTLFNERQIITETKAAYTLRATQCVGEGAEAEIYKLDNGTASKIYKDENRIFNLKEKLLILKNLDMQDNIVLPKQLVYFKDDNSFCGFTLRLLSSAKSLDKFKWRYMLNATQENELDLVIAELLFDICDILEALHRNRIFYGDLKPENILVVDQRAYLIDFDSSSIPGYPGNCFTIEYVDPLIRQDDPYGKGPYNFYAGSDWWALSVIAFELFMGVSPWDGLHPDYTLSKNPRAIRSYDYKIIGFDSNIKIPTKDSRSLMRSMNWLTSKQKLYNFFKTQFSHNGKRLSIAGALETYFSKSETRVASSSLTKRLQELEPEKSADDDKDYWLSLISQITKIAAPRSDKKKIAQERFLNMMLGI